MKELIQLAVAIAFMFIVWRGIRSIAKAIDYLANMKNNHDEITDLLIEIKNELVELNQKKKSFDSEKEIN